MAQSREVEYEHRFDGGLNLTDQTQNLRDNESPDCLNVDFGSRGGFTLRGGFQEQLSNQLLQDARIIGQFYVGTDQLVLIQGTDGSLLEWDGAALVDTTVAVTDDTSERVRGAGFAVPADSPNGQVYMSNCWSSTVMKMYKWDGTTLTDMTHAFNDDYLSPSGLAGNIPKARHVASWNGFLWVGDTEEGVSDIRYPTRVRFSHQRAPEDWATDDWFQVGDDQGDPITSLVPFGDRLMIFKRNSVWMVLGYDRDTWVLEQLSNASGTCTCGAIAVNSSVCYWFSTDGQLMSFNREGVVTLSQPINWWSEIGKIKHGGSHRLMWYDNRLWMSLQAGAGEDVARWLFIWDSMSKTFTRYDKQVTELISWIKTGSDGDPLFITETVYLTDDSGNRLTDVSGNYLVEDCSIYRWDRAYTTDTTAVGTERINGFYRTGWLRAGETATRKRWKRPRITAAAKGNATIRVDAYHDFNDLDIARTHDFGIAIGETESVWGTGLWGTAQWFQEADEYYEFARIGSSGTARAVSYKFSSPDNTSRWWVDSIAVPFRRKQVK